MEKFYDPLIVSFCQNISLRLDVGHLVTFENLSFFQSFHGVERSAGDESLDFPDESHLSEGSQPDGFNLLEL